MVTPYQKSLPAKQTCLLELWDELRVPHDELKQVYGSTLTIIGFKVDPNAMTMTMPLQAHSDLIDAVCTFASPDQWHSLCDLQRLAGWINWPLNAYPFLYPGLLCLYAKMYGKLKPHQLIWISISLCQELNWFINHIKNSDSVHILQSHEWDPVDADLSIFCDTCPGGMAFWVPSLSLGFQHHISAPPAQIFYFKALTVVSALHWCVHNLLVHPDHCPLIHTNNYSTVDMFNTL